MYKDLFEAQELEGFPGAIIGRIDNQCDHIFGALGTRAYRRDFRISPLTLTRYGLKRLRESILSIAREESATVIQFYDGGLQDFLVALNLAQRLPESTIIYNFHWATEWIEIFESALPTAVAFQATLRRATKSAGGKVRFSAETQPLADYVATHLGIECEVYPVFSSLRPRHERPWSVRQTDVLVMPQRASEIPFVIELVFRLMTRGFSVAIATRQAVWKQGLAVSKDSIASQPHHLPKVIFTPLDLADYSGLLEDAKLCVLPYDKPYFRWGSSGKFNEAILLGCFPFVPASTAIATQSNLPPNLHHFNPLEIDETADLLAQRLVQGLPGGLRGVSIGDFFEWITHSRSVANASTNAEFLRNNRLLFLSSIFLSWETSLRRLCVALGQRAIRLANIAYRWRALGTAKIPL
jgi:hypothetical protein